MRETLQWLDDITSKYPNIVTLQGADETYEQWAEVEKFVVPRTLFSENDGIEDVATEAGTASTTEEGLTKLALEDGPQKTSASSDATDGTRSLSPSSSRSQRSSMSAQSPPTSPVKGNASPEIVVVNKGAQAAPSGSGSVPAPLQPLFNYILWRIHQEIDPVAALESFIFLCNDQRKVNFAKGFEIKTKRLEQLREAINREDRDFKNRMTLLNKEGQNGTVTDSKDEDDDGEVVYKPPPRAPAAMLPKQQQAPSQTNVMDPDDFGRNTQPPNRPNFSAKQQSAPGNRGAFNGNYVARGNQRASFRGSPRGRGNFNPAVPRATAHVDGSAPNAQIDPNSFARPRGSGHAGRGGRKLWVPT